MSLDQSTLGSFGDLATALGLLGPDGSPNANWFGDPVGGGPEGAAAHGLKHVMADEGQREALIRFVDEILGPPDQRTESGQKWVPLFDEDDPDVTVYAVVDDSPATGDAVHLGIGFTHTTSGGPPQVTSSVHVPLFRFAERETSLTGGGSTPPWLLLGRQGGDIEVGVDATFSTAPPPAGEAALGGLGATLRVPTHLTSGAGPDVAFTVTLRDLQLPGATAPRTFTLDVGSPEDILEDVLDLVAGLVRAQAEALAGGLGTSVDPTLRRFAGLAGLLGLRDVGDLPSLPLADLPTLGVSALVAWAESVLADDAARDAWLAQLALLVGGTAVPARDAVTLDLDPLELTIGIRVEAGPGGHPVLVPWVELALATRSGAAARAVADLFRVDTRDGTCLAFPDVRLEGVFGSEAGGTALVTGTDPHVGGLRIGVGLAPGATPAVPVFRLTLHDVRLGQQHDVLDLSTPEAALDAGGSVVAGALTAALESLGAAGDLVADVLGLDPPAGVAPITATALLADPFAAVRDYWTELVADADALAETLGSLQELVTGAAAALAGSGTEAAPWRVDLVGPLGLRLWRDGATPPALHADLVVDAAVPVLGDYTATTSLRFGLLTLVPATGRVTFADGASVSTVLARTDAATARLSVGDLAVVADEIGVELRWLPAAGLTGRLSAQGLELEVDAPDTFNRASISVPVPLPEIDSTGRLVLPSPDWASVEAALAALVARVGLPELDAVVRLLGWSGSGPRLPLAGLLGADPRAAIESWVADLVLDCERVGAALGPVAALLSGFTRTTPLGTGNRRDPFRCPVAGEALAPGMYAWLEPGCAVPKPRLRVDLDPLLSAVAPDPDTVAAVLRSAPLPDVVDLLVGRDGLGTGLSELADRWTGSDGLVSEPGSLPAGVTAISLSGLSYAELVARGVVGGLVPEVLDPLPSAEVHVGCEPVWVIDRPAGTFFDLSGPAGSAPGPVVPATGAGTWTVRVPTPDEAAADRPDRGAVEEQAARLVGLLAERSEPVALIGYGAAGAAVVRAAEGLLAARPALELGVVTVGTPWGEVGTAALGSGLSGDALRLLGLLIRADAEDWPQELLAFECTPVQRTRLLVARGLEAARTTGGPPSATPVPGLAVTAVFGSLERDDLLRGIAAHAADGVEGRLADTHTSTPGPVTVLHAGIDLPVFDLDLGGLLVGLGLGLELVRVSRPVGGGAGGTGGRVEAEVARAVVADLHLGVHDGWLVGGPGSTSGIGDLRWLSARVEVPLDGTPGDCELVLHEVRGLGIDRERWVVRADAVPGAVDGAVDGGLRDSLHLAGESVTAAVPEIRVLLSAVAARLGAASADLGSLLGLLGLTRDGGLDPDALDRLLHDPAATLRGRLALAPAAAATALRALVPAADGEGGTVAWSVGPATVGVDLVTGTFLGSLATEDPEIDGSGSAAVDLAVGVGPGGASTHLTVGALDPVLGGFQLVAEAGTGAGGVSVALEWGAPGRPSRSVPLWPDLDPAPVADLVAALVPALGVKTLVAAALDLASDAGRELLEQALAVLGMLRTSAGGTRRLAMPVGLVTDPAGWFAGLVRSESLSLGPAGVALLEALAPLVVPARGADPGWPLAEGVTLGYRDDGGRLRLTLSAEVDAEVGAGASATTVTTGLTAGVVIGLGTPPEPSVVLDLDLDGRGLRLGVTPDLTIDLVRPGADPLRLHPDGPGFGDVLDTAAGLLVPRVLDLVADQRSGPAGIKRDVGRLLTDVGDALLLREGNAFAEQSIRELAADPGGVLLGRLPALLGTASAALVQALDPGGALARVTTDPGLTTFAFGSADSVTLALDTTGSVPALVLGAAWTVPDVGPVTLEGLRLSAAGVSVEARVGPVPVDAGPVSLRPVLEVRAGTQDPGDRLVAVGLALDDTGERSVQVRWGLDAQPPVLAAVTRAASPGSPDTVSEDDAPVWLLSLAVGLAGGILVDALDDLIGARAARMLRGVVLTETATATTPAVDAGFALDLLDPERLLARLERLLWNAATDTEPLSITIDGLVTISLASSGSGNDRQLGLGLTLAAGRRFTIADGSVKVELEVDATWLDPAVTPGLTVYAVRGVRTPGSPATYAFGFEPGVSVAGLGLRFTNTAGPLLELGPVSLDGIAFRLYAEAVAAGVGGGAQLELTGLAFAPTGGSGANPVAESILSDAAESSPSARPAFSPALAIQRHPGEEDFRVSVRAGPPPGPWWLVIQRQLGPLYLEQVGFDAAEVDGRVASVTLLFDGRVEIFGLTAAVDQLSLTWLGGDLFDIARWSVDLQGLAVSAELSGISLAGGMLKTTDDGVVSYVGMLLGKFGIYGLSVFGGYTDDAGNPSFFVFGAFNGPIGGPPAFFVTGIGGGLGINRRLVIPDDPSQFPSYPFIYALDPYAEVPEPMQALRDLNLYFGPERGTFWFAAGISFTCFSLVDGIAVVAVSFGNGLEINLMGLARMALPNPAAPLVSIELGLLARFSTSEGLFMIRAALTDNSWLLYEDVRLTGGFAFVIWWKGALAGQFVLTIGGYHPDFHRDGYPDVARVGLSWQVTDDISIKGGAYFALTSEALMAGVGVEAVADFGWAWARASFGADGLVYFDPFWFDVEVRATISAGIEIDTWLGTISFSVTTGCGVHVWGPDFSGEATVQVGPCSVTVPFGSGAERPGIQQDWPGFVAKYLEDAGEGVARGLSAITGRGSLPSATGGDRSAPPPDGTAARPFEVYAEFELTVTTSLPTNVFGLGPAGDASVDVVRSDGAASGLGLNPMGAGGLTSRLLLRLERLDQDDDAWEDDPDDLGQLTANIVAATPRSEGSRVATGSFPIGVWGQPEPPGTPAPALPAGDVLTTGNQVTLVAEAELAAPGPLVSFRTVETGPRRTLPLQARMTPRAALLDAAGALTLPSPATARDALADAGRLLFARPPTPVAHGPQPNGVRSNLDRASYAGRLSAPPMFGSLADGLASANGATAPREPVPTPEPAAEPELRSPRVVGFLAAGADLAVRRPGTTVADGRLPRRAAPTSESVLARLGRLLPVQLDVAVPPGRQVGTTVTPQVVPRTGAPGGFRSYPVGSAMAATAVAGLTGVGGPQPTSRGRAAGVTADPTPLRAGDVVVLHSPDHSVDRATAASRRPRLVVDGTARVTCLRGDGVVLADRVQQGDETVEPGTAYVVAQAGATVAPSEGLAGWHSRGQVVSLGTGSALAAGCVLTLDNSGASATVEWSPAGDVVRGATTVLTSFTALGDAVSSIVVVVEADDPDRVEDMSLQLVGASRLRDGSGTPVDPTIVVNGAQVAAIYPVTAEADATGSSAADSVPGAAGVSVRIGTGSSWRLTGVLAGSADVADTAALLSRHGVAAATARLLSPTGPGCTLRWKRGRSPR